MLEVEYPQAVSIAVPTALHEEVATAALKAGAQVLVEKPIAATLEEGQRLIELAKRMSRQGNNHCVIELSAPASRNQ